MFETSLMTNFNELCKRIQNNLFKVLILGDCGVGKTSLIKQTALNCFSPSYRATIGVDFVVKHIPHNDTTLKLQLWDIAGQERLSAMTRVYYKDAVAAFIVYDLTKPETFDSILKWREDINDKVLLPDGNYIPCMILANKCDEPERKGLISSPLAMDQFCFENEFMGWMLTSAKENIGIEEAFQRMAEELVNKKDLYPYICPSLLMDTELINLSADEAEEVVESRSKCKCNSYKPNV